MSTVIFILISRMEIHNYKYKGTKQDFALGFML